MIIIIFTLLITSSTITLEFLLTCSKHFSIVGSWHQEMSIFKMLYYVNEISFFIRIFESLSNIINLGENFGLKIEMNNYYRNFKMNIYILVNRDIVSGTRPIV